MVSSVGNPTDIAISGLLASQTQDFAAADYIPNANEGAPNQGNTIRTSNVAAPWGAPQPGGVAGQVFDALQATDTAQAGGGVSSTLGTTGNSFVDLTTQAISLSQASFSYQANAATLE